MPYMDALEKTHHRDDNFLSIISEAMRVQYLVQVYVAVIYYKCSACPLIWFYWYHNAVPWVRSVVSPIKCASDTTRHCLAPIDPIKNASQGTLYSLLLQYLCGGDYIIWPYNNAYWEDYYIEHSARCSWIRREYLKAMHLVKAKSWARHFATWTHESTNITDLTSCFWTYNHTAFYLFFP